MHTSHAEQISIKALEWLAFNQELFHDFLASTGMNVCDLSELIHLSEFQLAVLDFVLQSDNTVLACAEALDCSPEEIQSARSALPGGENYHWT